MQAPYNPYASPAASPTFVPPLVPWRARGRSVKWLYLVLSAGYASTSLLTGHVSRLGGALASLAAVGLVLAQAATVMVWLYTAWSDVPPAERGGTTPEGAVIKLLIPLYNLYWIFAVNTGLCAILDAHLGRAGSSRRAPVGLAIAGGILYLASTIFALPGLEAAHAVAELTVSAVWFAYMVRCDQVRAIVASAP